MCYAAVDDSLATFKLIPDWFLTSKLIKKFFTYLYADENILYFDEDSGKVVFNYNGMHILNVDLNIISLDNNLDENDPDATILIRNLAWHIKFEEQRELKNIYKWKINANRVAS